VPDVGKPQNVVLKAMSTQLAFVREINSAIARSSYHQRAQMARQLTDLFLINADRYSADEIALIDDVFVRLAVAIEESSRALLASRLGPTSKAPPKILRALACDDEIFVASSVLMHSEKLDDLTLLECAKTKSQDHLFAISRRKTLSETVTDVLVERGDQRVAFGAAQNPGARFSPKGFNILVKRSHGDDQLTICVGTRPDLPPQLFNELLKAASETVRSKLEAESPHAKREVDCIVADVTGRISTQATVESQEYAAARVLVDVLIRSGQMNAVKLEAFAKADRFEDTVVALAVMSGISLNIVTRKLDDEFAKFTVIMARAINLSWQTTLTILRLGARRHRCTAIEIERGLADFQRLDRQTASRIVASHRAKECAG
jgi:uncharacterized protein (DUF2336 family)